MVKKRKKLKATQAQLSGLLEAVSEYRAFLKLKKEGWAEAINATRFSEMSIVQMAESIADSND